MKVPIPKVLRIHMRIFRVIGYCNLSFNENLKCSAVTERWLIMWSSFLLIAYNVASLVVLTSNDEYLFADDKFGYFNDALKVIFGSIAVTTTYLESIFKRSEIYKFWTKYNFLQNKTNEERKFISFVELWENRRFLGIFYIVVIFELTVMAVFLILNTMTRHLIMFWSSFTPFIYAVHLRNMQFIFYIEIIRLELVKLQQDLSLMADYSRFVIYGCGFKGYDKYLRKKLLERQKNYQIIYEMFEHFQKGFGFSIITVLLMIYVRVLVDAYFGCYTIYRGWNNIEIILLIPACLQIPFFLITSKNCMDVVKLITFNLHSIITQLKDNAHIVSTQLQNFSLQILHQRICINGIGISRMDGYMLTKAIGSVTTYMIFFIQFMPKFTNFQEDTKIN